MILDEMTRLCTAFDTWEEFWFECVVSDYSPTLRIDDELPPYHWHNMAIAVLRCEIDTVLARFGSPARCHPKPPSGGDWGRAWKSPTRYVRDQERNSDE